MVDSANIPVFVSTDGNNFIQFIFYSSQISLCTVLLQKLTERSTQKMNHLVMFQLHKGQMQKEGLVKKLIASILFFFFQIKWGKLSICLVSLTAGQTCLKSSRWGGGRKNEREARKARKVNKSAFYWQYVDLDSYWIIFF